MKVVRLAAIALCALWASFASAQAWPTKPVKIIVPFTAGSATDILARTFGQKLSEYWGQPVVIENRPGAGGTIGTGIVANAPPDANVAPTPASMTFKAVRRDEVESMLSGKSDGTLTASPRMPAKG